MLHETRYVERIKSECACPQILRSPGRLPREPPPASNGGSISITLKQPTSQGVILLKIETCRVWCVAPVDVLSATDVANKAQAGLKMDHAA